MKVLPFLLVLPLLASCGDTQHAAYLISGGNHSLALTRQQAYIGSDWDVELVVARFPECQRRYVLSGMGGDKLKMDVYRADPGVFILNAGKRWYVTETATCRFEQYKEPPPEPGVLIGSFLVKDGKLDYKDLEGKKSAVAPAPTSSPAP